MANTKISALTPNTNPSGSEEMVYALNNANGKMSLNTMKTFVENNLTGYATTADLATKQDTLVSGTNIRTINGASVVGSGDIIVTGGTGYTAGPGIDITGGVISATGGGAGGYDCIVADDGTGDYTTIGAAISAGNYNIFVKNGSYTESTYWDMYSQNKSFLHIIGESQSGVQITIPSTVTLDNYRFLDMRYGNAADFYMENLTFNITFTINETFYTDNGGSNFIVKNCTFNYDCIGTPSQTSTNIFATDIINNSDGSRKKINGLIGCTFNATSTAIVNITEHAMRAYGCYFNSSAGRIQLVQLSYKANLYDCNVDTFILGGTGEMTISNTYINVGDGSGGFVDDGNSNDLYIEQSDNSYIVLQSSLSTTPAVNLGLCLNSTFNLQTYQVNFNSSGNNKGLVNCYIVAGLLNSATRMSNCQCNCTSLSVGNRGWIEGCWFGTSMTTATLSGSGGSIVNGNVFRATGTMTVSGTNNIVTNNLMPSITLTDTGTGTVKANNITA